MSKQRPVSRFKWMTDDELDDWRRVGRILEVDLEYPEHLHNLHNAPKCVRIGNVQKLIPNLNNKTYYVVHYENLKLYESHGLTITDVYMPLL